MCQLMLTWHNCLINRRIWISSHNPVHTYLRTYCSHTSETSPVVVCFHSREDVVNAQQQLL
uniref:Uncharacterized protein n=1 Tax=Nelumbo nucifera TaxID=4432 RepID=A0A822XUN1_NELNU|nr:TPA_asm: hypothetical protein HUJ06_024916 [Nelumbo nucifera]